MGQDEDGSLQLFQASLFALAGFLWRRKVREGGREGRREGGREGGRAWKKTETTRSGKIESAMHAGGD